jgi:hypothetical protein
VKHIFPLFSLTEALQLIGVLELPLASIFGIVGGYVLWKKISGSKELLEWIALLRESKDTLKELLKEYKKTNGNQ